MSWVTRFPEGSLINPVSPVARAVTVGCENGAMRPFDPHLLRAAPATRLPVAVLALLGGLGGIVAIAQAVAVAHLVVAVVEGHALLAPGLWVLALFAARGMLSGATELAAAHAGARVSGALREAAMRRWMTQTADERPAPSAMLTMATKGAAAVEPYVARYLPALVTAGVVPVLAVVAMLWVDWRSALIVIVTLPLLPLFAALIGKYTQRATAERWVETTMLAGHFADVVAGLPTLVAYGRGNHQVEQVRKVGDRHRSATMRTLRIAFLSSAALDLLATISVAMVAVAVGLRLANGHVSLLTGLMAILIAPEAYWPIRRVGQEFHAAADGAEAIDSLLADERERPWHAPAPETSSGLARAMMSGVTYTYPGQSAPAITHTTGVVRDGLTALTGPSGSGKSTLLEILAGARRPDSGRLEVPSTHLVSQRAFIAPMSVRANLELGNDASVDEMRTAMAATGFDDVVLSMPDGVRTSLGDNGFGLSAGQRARLVLTRAWLSDAAMVLLDEPTAHLDPASAADIRSAIVALSKRKPVVVVTHDDALAAAADHQWRVSARSPQRYEQEVTA